MTGVGWQANKVVKTLQNRLPNKILYFEFNSQMLIYHDTRES